MYEAEKMFKSEQKLIKESLTEADILCGIAEEASEVAQAALKLRRTLDESNNPTPLSRLEAFVKLEEEVYDLLSYFVLWDWPLSDISYHTYTHHKWRRWANRVKEARL